MSVKSFSLLGSLIILVTLVAYIPAMQAGFIWDDDLFLTNNPLIKATDGLYRFWFTTEPPDYFPLVSTSLWLEWRLWGMNATGYHVVNIVLHAISAVLVWLVLKRLKIRRAWLAALIFVVHPVNVESVAWITERKNTQPLVFYLLSILLYLRFESDGNRRWYVFALLAFLLALLSKTSVVMLPFVLLGCAWWQRDRISTNDFIRVIPFFILAGALALVTLWFQYNVAMGGTIVRTDSFLARLAGAGRAVWFYAYKAILPYRLSFVYPRWKIDATSIVSYFPTVGLIVCFAVFWRYRKGWARAFLFGFGYYVVTLFPVLGFFDIYFMKYSLVADHWQYTSIIGVISLAVGIGSYVEQRGPKIPPVPLNIVMIALVGILCMLTWRQQNIYANAEALWRDTIAKNPEASIAHKNLGVLLRQTGRVEEAIAHFSQVLRIKFDDEGGHNNLGLALYDKGEFDEAIGHYQKALKIRPDYAEAYHNLGLVYLKQKKPGTASKQFSRALQLKPEYVEAYDQLGVALYVEGKLNEAIGYLSQALQLRPDYAEAHSNLGIIFAQKREFDAAQTHFLEALRIKPDFAEAHYNLGLVLCQRGSIQEAIGHFSKALQLRPDYADAHHSLGIALAFQGRPGEAMKHFSEAVKIRPQFAEAHLNLGAILASQDRLDEAISHFREALRIKPDFVEAKRYLEKAVKESQKRE